LLQKKVRPEDMIKAGVSIKPDKGGNYDRFRNRITFPIFNYAGDVVGFSARTLDASADTAKYINSPETIVYNKSRTVFGLYQGRDAIRKLNQVVVAEGQLDVISCHQAGFNNVVATSGTALTDGHLQLLGRLTKNILFCFDADDAGQRATRKASELALAQGFRLKIMALPQGKDPDELVQRDPKLWQNSIDNAKWAVDYYIDEVAHIASGSVEQARAVRESLSPLISLLADPIEQDHYVQKIANVFGLKAEAIAQTVTKNKSASEVADVSGPKPTFNYGNEETLEMQLLGGAMLLPQFRAEIAGVPDFKQAFSHSDIKELVIQILSSDGPVPENVSEQPLAKEAQFMVESLIENLDLSQDALLHELNKSL
jgi:DNA primase